MVRGAYPLLSDSLVGRVMNKLAVSMAIHEEDVELVVVVLSRLESLDLNQVEQHRGDAWQGLEEKLKDVAERLRNSLAQLEVDQSDIHEVTHQLRPSQDAAHAEDLLKELQPKLEEWRQEKRKIEEQLGWLRKVLANIELLRTVGMTVKELHRLNYLEMKFGWVPSVRFSQVILPLLRTPTVIVPLLEKGKRMLISAATIKKNDFILDRMLQSLPYEPIELPKDSETAAQVVEAGQGRIADLKKRLRTNRERGDHLERNWGSILLEMLGKIEEDRKIVRQISQCRTSGSYYLLNGSFTEANTGLLLDSVKQAAEHPHATIIGKRLKPP